MKKRPVSAAAVAHPPPHPDSTLSLILTCPERGDSEVQSPLRAVTPGAVGTSGASGDERRGEAARSQASTGISAATGSRSRPPHPGGARAADAARTPRRMSQARGRAARGAGPWRGAGASLLRHPRGGDSLWGKGAPLPVAAAGRGAAGRRHRMHSVRELLPSEVTGRYAPGRGQGFAAQASPPLPRKTKGTRGLGREKFSARLQMDLIETSRPKRRRGGLVGGVRMRGGLPGASRQDPHQGVSQS